LFPAVIYPPVYSSHDQYGRWYRNSLFYAYPFWAQK